MSWFRVTPNAGPLRKRLRASEIVGKCDFLTILLRFERNPCTEGLITCIRVKKNLTYSQPGTLAFPCRSNRSKLQSFLSFSTGWTLTVSKVRRIRRFLHCNRASVNCRRRLQFQAYRLGNQTFYTQKTRNTQNDGNKHLKTPIYRRTHILAIWQE
jgi:hypothetical protein